MRGSGRETLILTLVAVVIGGAGLAFGYLPCSRELDRCRQEAAGLQAALEADRKTAQGLPELLRQVETLKGKLQDFDRRLPKRQELGGFLRDISASLSRENLSNQAIEPGKPTQEDLLFTLPIVLKFRGSYASVARFLERIDRLERLTRVQKLSVVPAPSDDLLDVTVQMNIYFIES
jgi:Tfp pilus assembly protein PilO